MSEKSLIDDIEKLEDEVDRLRAYNNRLKQSLKEMLAVYWSEGDGQEPPVFIKKAQELVKD